MSYQKSCNRCGNTIFLSEGNDGKWHPFEDSMLSMPHRCNDARTSNSVMEKVRTLEKIVRQLNDKIILQQEKIAELNSGRKI